MVTRTELVEMYRSLGNERTDGGKDLTLDDHLQLVGKAKKVGITPAKLAQSLNVPADYVRAICSHLGTSFE